MSFGNRITETWKGTERLRAGAKAALQMGTLLGGAVRAVDGAPPPRQITSVPSQPAAIVREIEREGTKRLKSYGAFEINRLANEQRRLVNDLPKRPPAERTAQAAAQSRAKRAIGRAHKRGR